MALPTALLVKAAASRGCARHLAGTRVTPYTDSPVAKGYSPGRVGAANMEQRAIAPAGVPGSIFSPRPPVSRDTIVQSMQLTSSIGTTGPSGRRAALTGPRACPWPPLGRMVRSGRSPALPGPGSVIRLRCVNTLTAKYGGGFGASPAPPRPRLGPGPPPGSLPEHESCA